ncbi:hypothetical protein BU15DRAFT_40791 [Melanogaster broomeanus]|nr:hypothetical protein BU15DRAFT_40791 [Melanogaster broomeanus]
MAKPKHGQSATHTFQPSSQTSRRHQQRPYLRHTKQHRRRTSRSSSSSTHCPSPAVLSALAVIAATPVVAGTPLPVQTTPPSFLCPFIERDTIDLTLETPIAHGVSSSTPPSSLPPTPIPQSINRRLADKYVQGPDGGWRKTDAWTLYGSTCCSGTSDAGVNGTQSQSGSQTTMAGVTPTPVELDASVLPAGWKSTSPSSSNTGSTTILVIAVVLAGSICVFILGCIIWRKRKKSSKDIEHKVGNKPRHSSDISEREKDARGKMRIWAKATARWKNNVRQAARRRRKRHSVSPRFSHPPSPVLHDSRSLLVDAPSDAASPPEWFAHQEADTATSEMALPNDTDTSTIAEQSPVLPNVTAPPGTSSPPAYRSPVMQRSTHSHATLDSTSTRSHHGSLLFEEVNYSSAVEDEPIPYVPPRGGHVATDDKAHLARIQELASSPPEVVGATRAGSRPTQVVSAPELDEVLDELDDFGVEACAVPVPASFATRSLGLPPSFPPLPSKGDVPSGYFDGNPFCYGEEDGIPVLDPDAEPSAPPFDASPSAPPISDFDLDPSAPSLEDENTAFQDWDRNSSYAPEVSATASSDATPATARRSSISLSMSPTSCASLSSRRASVTRDGMLPLYHP